MVLIRQVRSDKLIGNIVGAGGILFEDMPKVFKLAKTATYELFKNENKFMQANIDGKQMGENNNPKKVPIEKAYKNLLSLLALTHFL